MQRKPKNAKYATTTYVNKVIFKQLDKRFKMIDGRLRTTQEYAVKAATIASKVASK